MVRNALARPAADRTNWLLSTGALEIFDAPDEEILRMADEDEKRLEEWYRAEVMPVLYERAEPALAEYDGC